MQNRLPLNGVLLGTAGAPELIADDQLEDSTVDATILTQVRNVSTDTLEDTTPSDELVDTVLAATVDTLEDTSASTELVGATKHAVDDVLEEATAAPEVVGATLHVQEDVLSSANSDELIVAETQTGAAGDDVQEDTTVDGDPLTATAAFYQDQPDDATADDLPLTAAMHAVDDVLDSATADATVTQDTPFYRQDVTADVAALDEPVAATLTSTVTVAEDATPSDELVGATLAARQDEASDATAKGALIAREDITETATAADIVIRDPIRDDITEWVWPRDRIANKYTDEFEEVRSIEASVQTKLRMDIAVDITATDELAGESKAYKADVSDTATADELLDTLVSALADLEAEAYIGGAVTNAAGSFYNTLIEDADGSDELTQRLVTSIELIADANGRDDVAGSAWFKSHSFIESATASDELLTEVVRRPTKDDVMESATGDEALLTARLDAWAAWSDDALAEAELLGNESGEAWVFNTRTLAFSRYVEFEASQVTTVDDEPLAAGARGVMKYGTAHAEGFVKTGLSDFGAPQLKRVRHAYVTAASRQPLALSTLHGIGDVLSRTTYQVDTLDSTVPYTHRLNLARGDQGQFWAFELRAPAGTPTTLLNLRIVPLVTSRRI